MGIFLPVSILPPACQQPNSNSFLGLFKIPFQFVANLRERDFKYRFWSILLGEFGCVDEPISERRLMAEGDIGHVFTAIYIPSPNAYP